MKIVALTGPKGSGKDTVADIICRKFNHVKRVAFADPIKAVVQHIFLLDEIDNYEYDRLKRSKLQAYGGDHETTWKNVDGRHVVREIGMLMRGYDDKQFTEYVRKELTSVDEKKYIGIVTDLRFDNEYLMLKELGAKIIKINRPSHDYDGHITERGFDDHLVDRIVLNDGDIEYLKTRVKIVINSLIEESK